ncbi:MAG TPA: rod shape-determining protein MreC [candidate division Zixibacteria bacterium]|nr:rod shape-determining protein MreC [candidate division Zixibacteria bacterium]
MISLLDTIKRHLALSLWIFSIVAGILLSQTPLEFRAKISGAFMNTLYTPFTSLSRTYHLLRDRRIENLHLKEELTTVKLRIEALKEAQRENERLRKLLGFAEKIEYNNLLAEVVGRGTPRNPGALVANVGTNRGVIIGLPVIDENGIVGKVISVYDKSCVIQLMNDPNFKISSMGARSRVQGIVSADARGVIIMENVPVDADIRRGDLIISSGLGGVFPEGLIVGRVSRVAVPQAGLFMRVEIEPSADLSRLEEVFILFVGMAGDGSSMSTPDTVEVK